MYGLIGSMKAAEVRRDELISILLDGIGDMPGCLSYVVATDPEDEHTIWITEVWDSRESHEGSLELPAVQTAISRAMPIIAGFEKGKVTTPVGGHGLPKG